MFKKAGKKLKEKDVGVIVFPEGTRYNDPEKAGMLPFKKGAFLLAKYAKCPIIPIVAMDLHNLYSDPHKWCVPGVIKIRVLPPIWLDQENSRTDAKESNNRNANDSENSTSEAGRHPDTGVSVEKLMQDTWDLMYKNLLEISDPRMDIEALRSESKKSV
ncbi:1-acyl-sn-glycerol-3-phosphate acyltransferase alpha [Zancudomyces culisetae]|uniref:1-acyl-sn-glycerol-3-phosphate acyltransferase alpha n=1 Tax=Zancudomyces culisetae TaxID=1213189 RepID=A0A1R1PWZ0_ZANCU|nr:1-acyl-sn-glycerol-3-phosphate acyltransferase alpha [Zancudomyces culisetae]|eukprot:OMH85506.1 1-acyl-sn-glycerol-3-phosphate acyltransferase alpha [Zancudomyces culisetae]